MSPHTTPFKPNVALDRCGGAHSDRGPCRGNQAPSGAGVAPLLDTMASSRRRHGWLWSLKRRYARRARQQRCTQATASGCARAHVDANIPLAA